MSYKFIPNVLLILIILYPYTIYPYSTDSKRPNIFFVLGDDWGWNDVGFNNASDAETPTMDYYARTGLILHKYYAQFLCTQTRAALLSGRYASHIGMQHEVWNPGYPWGLPLSLKLMPEALKEHGYKTHMVGKWHLGFPSWEYYPLKRGFDSFIGFLNGEEDYEQHNYTYAYNNTLYPGADFRDEYEATDTDIFGTYLYSERILQIFEQSQNNDDPFFIYGAVQLVHTPREAPQSYINKYNDSIESYSRQVTCAQANFFDDEFKKWMDKLKELDMWNNTIVIWVSDNGGQVDEGGSSWPLRGMKGTSYEGGYRCPGFINGGFLPENRRGIISTDLFHVTDWFPTFLSMLGDFYQDSYDFDGIDQSNMILRGTSGHRNSMLLNIDNYECTTSICGALIWKNWKLAIGDELTGDSAIKSGWISLNGTYGTPSVHCNGPEPNWFRLYSNDRCPYDGTACLWNLDTDPCEYNDVKQDHPEIFHFLWQMLLNWNESTVLPLAQVYADDNQIEEANPIHFNGFWTPWQDTLENDLSPQPWYKRWNFAAALA